MHAWLLATNQNLHFFPEFLEKNTTMDRIYMHIANYLLLLINYLKLELLFISEMVR